MTLKTFIKVRCNFWSLNIDNYFMSISAALLIFTIFIFFTIGEIYSLIKHFILKTTVVMITRIRNRLNSWLCYNFNRLTASPVVSYRLRCLHSWHWRASLFSWNLRLRWLLWLFILINSMITSSHLPIILVLKPFFITSWIISRFRSASILIISCYLDLFLNYTNIT